MNDLPRDNDGSLTRFAWPGGYPVLYLDRDNETLCPACAQKSLDLDPTDRMRACAYFVHYEGAPEYCAECGAEVESAYGNPDDDSE